MLNEILASLVVGSGIIFGAVLRNIAKEEVRPGTKYFALMKNIVFAVTVLASSYFYNGTNATIAVILLVFITIISIRKFQPLLMYMAFAVLYLLSMKKPDAFVLVSSLIFIAGFPIGTLMEGKGKKRWINVFIPYMIFLLITEITILII